MLQNPASAVAPEFNYIEPVVAILTFVSPRHTVFIALGSKVLNGAWVTRRQQNTEQMRRTNWSACQERQKGSGPCLR